MKARGRRGFSLMEVLLATSILLGSVIVLSELARIGRNHATNSQELATAELRCLDKLNEILAGLAPLETVQDVPFEEQPGWLYSVTVDPVESTGLSAVQVHVEQDESSRPEGRSRTGKPAAQFTLVRWVRERSPDEQTFSAADGGSPIGTRFAGSGGLAR